MRSRAAFGAAVLTALALLTGAPASASTVSCSSTDLPVSVGLLPMTVHGKLCLSAGSTPTTVQLLLHGATYNSSYWDLPYLPDQYSYQLDMATHGLATFAIDELGVGQSSRPLSTLLTGEAQANAVHTVVGALRAGQVGGLHFTRVVLVGHSAGSGISVMEASTYHDVDGVVLTGMAHLLNMTVASQDILFDLQPVTLDPVLSQRGGDPGYLTTKPGLRGQMFYSPGDIDQAVVDTDEAVAKDQVSGTSLTDILSVGLVSPASLGITVPVFLVDGTNDTGFCGVLRDCSTADALRAQEAPYFSAAAMLSVYVLQGAGHCVALAANASEYRDATRAWLHQYFGL